MLHEIEPIQILTGCNTSLNHSTQRCCVESPCSFLLQFLSSTFECTCLVRLSILVLDFGVRSVRNFVSASVLSLAACAMGTPACGERVRRSWTQRLESRSTLFVRRRKPGRTVLLLTNGEPLPLYDDARSRTLVQHVFFCMAA